MTHARARSIESVHINKMKMLLLAIGGHKSIDVQHLASTSLLIATHSKHDRFSFLLSFQISIKGGNSIHSWQFPLNHFLGLL